MALHSIYDNLGPQSGMTPEQAERIESIYLSRRANDRRRHRDRSQDPNIGGEDAGRPLPAAHDAHSLPSSAPAPEQPAPLISPERRQYAADVQKAKAPRRRHRKRFQHEGSLFTRLKKNAKTTDDDALITRSFPHHAGLHLVATTSACQTIRGESDSPCGAAARQHDRARAALDAFGSNAAEAAEGKK